MYPSCWGMLRWCADSPWLEVFHRNVGFQIPQAWNQYSMLVLGFSWCGEGGRGSQNSWVKYTTYLRD